VILFAGLYEYWQPKPEQWERTFTIVTTDANELMRSVHDRMPVVLSEDAVDQWLLPKQDADALRPLLVPAPEELLVATPVSPRVNSVKNDDPGVLEEVASPGLIQSRSPPARAPLPVIRDPQKAQRSIQLHGDTLLDKPWPNRS